MQLALDIGNSRTKYGVFKGSELVESGIIQDNQGDWYSEIAASYHIRKGVYCSTRLDIKQIERQINLNLSSFLAVKSGVPLPFANLYASPDTLGADRLAAVCGAYHLFPNSSFLVIDAGTCITFEFFRKNLGYLGGRILPGIEMRFKSMHQFTDKLPLIEEYPRFFEPLIYGDDTRSCLVSGVLQGVVNELHAAITEFKTIESDLKIIITGGNAEFFASYFKNEIFAVPDLVLTGLNTLLLYNESIDSETTTGV